MACLFLHPLSFLMFMTSTYIGGNLDYFLLLETVSFLGFYRNSFFLDSSLTSLILLLRSPWLTVSLPPKHKMLRILRAWTWIFFASPKLSSWLVYPGFMCLNTIFAMMSLIFVFSLSASLLSSKLISPTLSLALPLAYILNWVSPERYPGYLFSKSWILYPPPSPVIPHLANTLPCPLLCFVMAYIIFQLE